MLNLILNFSKLDSFRIYIFIQYPRKAETAFTGDLEAVKEGARHYLSTGQ